MAPVYEIELLEERADLFLFGERGRSAPPGVAGGAPGASNRFSHPGPDGAPTAPPMASKLTGARLEQGQRVRLETPGGGGYGDPAAREPERVARDVALGLVSREAAAQDYRVALAPDGAVDSAATARLRGSV